MDFEKILPIWPDGEKVEEEKNNLPDERELHQGEIIMQDKNIEIEKDLKVQRMKEHLGELGQKDEDNELLS